MTLLVKNKYNPFIKWFFMEDFQCFSDEQLQQMSVSGSVGAEDALAARYNQLVRICARPYFLAGGDSEDLTQEECSAFSPRSGSTDRAGRSFQGVCGFVHPAADLQCDQIGVLFEAYPLNSGVSYRWRMRSAAKASVPVCMRPFDLREAPRKNRFWRERTDEFFQTFSRCLSFLNRRSCRCI